MLLYVFWLFGVALNMVMSSDVAGFGGVGRGPGTACMHVIFAITACLPCASSF